MQERSEDSVGARWTARNLQHWSWYPKCGLHVHQGVLALGDRNLQAGQLEDNTG
jgi:hypothetical protein